MHRRPLLALLADYRCRYPEETATVDRARRFVEDHADCFARGQRRGHVTGSAWLVDPAGRRVLLTHHRKLGLWVQLGGHADGNPDVLAVALAEAREESGIAAVAALSGALFDVDIHAIPARGDEPGHVHYDMRFALRATHERYVVSAESHDLAWFAVDELAAVTRETSMLRMARKWRRVGRDLMP